MISYSQEEIGFINLFENLTHSQVKDCFKEDDVLVFVVQPGEIAKAIGKQGANIKKVSFAIKKRIKIIEFNPQPEKFLLNLVYPIRPKEIVLENNELIITPENNHDKGQIFGRDRQNLKRIQEILNKYFNLKIIIK